MLEVCQRCSREAAALAFHHSHQREPREIDEVAACFHGPRIIWLYMNASIWSAALRAGAQRSCAPTAKFDRTRSCARRDGRALSRQQRRARQRHFSHALAIERRACAFALGTDVGGGTGFGMLKEGLQAYLMQRVAAEPDDSEPGATAVSGDARRGGGAGHGGSRSAIFRPANRPTSCICVPRKTARWPPF